MFKKKLNFFSGIGWDEYLEDSYGKWKLAFNLYFYLIEKESSDHSRLISCSLYLQTTLNRNGLANTFIFGMGLFGYTP